MSRTTRLTVPAVTLALTLSIAAAAQAADSIVHTTGTTTYAHLSPTATEAFTDEATGDTTVVHADAHGTPQTASSIDYGAPGDQPTIRWVVFAEQGYADALAPPAPRVPETHRAFVARLRATGRVTPVAREVLDGRGTVVLQSTHGGQITERYWVDEATGEPLREEERGTGYVTRLRFAYLPRTPENLARLQLPVPAGFTRVASLPVAAPFGAPASPRLTTRATATQHAKAAKRGTKRQRKRAG